LHLDAAHPPVHSRPNQIVQGLQTHLFPHLYATILPLVLQHEAPAHWRRPVATRYFLLFGVFLPNFPDQSRNSFVVRRAYPFLGRLRLHLHTMPLLNLLSKHLIHKPVLLHDRQALELLGNNVQRIHRATAATDVLDLYPHVSNHRSAPFDKPRCARTSNLSGFKASLSMLKTLSSFSSR
jgi:hypothetical protein